MASGPGLANAAWNAVPGCGMSTMFSKPLRTRPPTGIRTVLPSTVPNDSPVAQS
jgi:hypothetical protein